MRYLVNSSPKPGYRYEPSVRFANAVDALLRAAELGRRGMRLVRIVDTKTGQVYQEAALRTELKGAA